MSDLLCIECNQTWPYEFPDDAGMIVAPCGHPTLWTGRPRGREATMEMVDALANWSRIGAKRRAKLLAGGRKQLAAAAPGDGEP